MRSLRLNQILFWRSLCCAITMCVLTMAQATYGEQDNWRDTTHRCLLSNDIMEARFQSGLLYELKDRTTGKSLVSIDPSDLSSVVPLTGPSGFNLDKCRVSQTQTKNSLQTIFRHQNTTIWTLNWTIEPAKGDLVLSSSMSFPNPLEEIRLLFPGCNIEDYTLVWVHAYGTAATANAPWNGTFLADPEKEGSPNGFPHPLVALFQGQNSGWFIEGHEERVGPANIMVKGYGDTVNIGFTRKFPLTEKNPHMYEIRISAYHGNWEPVVDPYVSWLENGAGFLALDKLPEQQQWINRLKTQAYIMVGNYLNLDELAKRVNPQETFVGRQGDLRFHAFDVAYPDYRIPEPAKKWIKHARKLGFHVGMHFNSKSVSVKFPDLIEKLKPGFLEIGKDSDGNPIYDSIYTGDNRHYRVSPSLKAWRDLLVERIREAVEAGIDVVYLDESMSPGGKFVVDGIDGYQGTFELMQQIRKEYPHVAIQTEQFNTLTAKYGKIALSQMPLGHPLSGYIFRKFVKIVPESVMYSPTDLSFMDAFDSWGYMLPGTDAQREDSWMQIAEAFHHYQLVPDPTLAREHYTQYQHHYTSGYLPVISDSIPQKGEKLFGFKGKNNVIAYLEKHPNRRGLVVYEPGKVPREIGTRHFGIRSYTGPGIPVYYGFRELIKDWLIYDGQTILGLDPNNSYFFDDHSQPDPDRFHLFQVPDDFAGAWNMEARALPQETGKDDIYICLRLSGHGQIGVYIPENYLTYLNGNKLEANPETHNAYAQINSNKPNPSGAGYFIALSEQKDPEAAKVQVHGEYLLAFKKTNTELKGNWPALPWHRAVDSLRWITGDGAGGFEVAVGATGRIVGKFPNTPNLRIQGSYGMKAIAVGTPGDGVIRINGTEVLRVPYGEKPYQNYPFDVDISSYAGQYAIVEFVADAPVRGAAAHWINPRFVIGDK